MLAERVKEWTQQWKQEGLQEGRQAGRQEGLQEGLQEGRQEGRQEGLEKARGVLVQNLERRFGPLPEEIRRRVDAVTSIEELTELSIRAGAASSLAALTAP